MGGDSELGGAVLGARAHAVVGEVRAKGGGAEEGKRRESNRGGGRC